MALETPNLDNAKAIDSQKEQSEVNMEDGNNSNLAEDNSEEDSQENEVENEASEEAEEVLDKSLLRQNSSDFLDDPSQFYFDDDLPTPDLSNENSNDVMSSQGLNTNENSNEAAALEREMVDDDSDEKQDNEQTDLVDKEEDDILESEEDEEKEEIREKENENLEDSEQEEEEESDKEDEDSESDIEESNADVSEHDENSDLKSNEQDLKQNDEDDEDEGSIIMDEYLDFEEEEDLGEEEEEGGDEEGEEDDQEEGGEEEEEDQGEEEEEKEEETEEEERENMSIDNEGDKQSLVITEEEKEDEELGGEEEGGGSIDGDMENTVDSEKVESGRKEKGKETNLENEKSLENVEDDKREQIELEKNVEKTDVKNQTEAVGKELVVNNLNTCEEKDTGANINKTLDINNTRVTRKTKSEEEVLDKVVIDDKCEIKTETELINTMEDKPNTECVKSPRRLRSSLPRIEKCKTNLRNDTKIEKSASNPGNIKQELPDQELPDTCVGFQINKLELDQIRLKKDLIQSRINTIDKFLDPNIKGKEWRKNEALEDEKLTEIRQRRPKQRRLTETEVMQRLGGKRKRSVDTATVEDKVIVKPDGRGRPKGWRKVKEEVVCDDSAVENSQIIFKPIVKRRKKDELLLMKALDEEMLKMDEDNTKEMERISQGLDYQCSVCSQVFIEKINLSKHFFKCLMKFTQSGRSSFKCSICFEYFSLLESLEAHVLRKHDGICEEPFQCSACSLCFEQGSALKVHVLEKHDVFQCWICTKYYRNQHTLNIHLAKKHPGVSRDSKPIEKNSITTNTPTVTSPCNSVISTRNTRGKASNVTNNIKQEPIERVKIEPTSSSSQPNGSEPRKKLGRPFKRKLSDDQFTAQPVYAAQPVVQSTAQPVLQDVAQGHSITHVPQSETIPQSESIATTQQGLAAYGATTPQRLRKSGEKIPPCVTPEENGVELGRGRRVKKKKALDYEDSISTTPGRRVTVKRKSGDVGQSGQLGSGQADGISGSGQIGQLVSGQIGSNGILLGSEQTSCSNQSTLGGQSVETNSTNGLPIHGTHQINNLKTSKLNPNDGRLVGNRNSNRTHQIPQPRILHLKPIPLLKVIQPQSLSVEKVINMRSENCSKGTNTFSNPDSNPDWKVFPPTAVSSNVTSTSENDSQSIIDDIPTDPSEQPIQQSIESSVYLNRKVHLCPKCRKPFPNKYLVKVHMKRRHNIFKRKTVIVPQTGEENSSGRTSDNRSRSRPKAQAQGNRETLFKCALCEASFPSFYSLEDHYLRIHEGIPCGVCRIRIKNRMLLDKHLNACHAPEERYVCPVCDKRMKSKETLRKHIVMHEDRRPYDCNVCKRSFRYSYDMRLHMRRTHPKEFARTNNAGNIEEETGGDE